MKKFDESKHPRDEEGKFTNKNTSSSSVVATKEKESNEYTEKVKKYKETLNALNQYKNKCFFEKDKIEFIKKSPKSFVLNFDCSLEDFIKHHINNNEEKLVIRPVSKKVIDIMNKKFGINITGFDVGIESHGFKHIFNHHGNPIVESNRNQTAIDMKNIYSVFECIDNPDIIFPGINEGSFIFRKDGNFTSVETISYKSNRKKSLMIKTAYINNK